MDSSANFFREEAYELLTKLEGNLLDLNRNSDNIDLLNDVFRALHTLKGSGAMFGFFELADFVHNIESIFDRVRKKELALHDDLINLTLEARDFMKILLTPEGKISKSDRANIARLTKLFMEYSAKSVQTKPSPVPQPEIIPEPAEALPEPEDKPIQIFRIRFEPDPEYFASGNNPLLIISELAGMGELTIKPVIDKIPDLESLNPEKCFIAWDLTLKTVHDLNAVRDVFLFVEDLCRLKIDQGSTSSETPASAVLPSSIQAVNADIDKINRNGGSQNAVDNGLTGIKVDSSKLDRLISLLGELVTVQSKINQVAETRNDSELMAIAQELDALTGELRDNALKLSMLPVDSIFHRLQLYGETISTEMGRKVRFKFSGGNTELDKGVLSRLFDPVTSLIAFCIKSSHEETSRRIELNKDPAALIAIAAWHSSGNVCISIDDDGTLAGLTPDQESELSRLRKIVEEMRGTLEMKLSPGSGAGAGFVIQLPMNLAIIDGLMIRLDDRLFVFPLSFVEECIELSRADCSRHYDKDVVMVRGQIVPFISLRKKFAITGQPPELQQVVIINQNGRRVGFAVDQVVGEYQTVIKNWGKFCSHTPGITGATILGDGSIALIADLPVLIEEERNSIQ